jgi:hypothetical protein
MTRPTEIPLTGSTYSSRQMQSLVEKLGGTVEKRSGSIWPRYIPAGWERYSVTIDSVGNHWFGQCQEK